MYSVSIPIRETAIRAAARANVQWLEIQGAAMPDQTRDAQREYLRTARDLLVRHGLRVASIHFCYTEPWLGSHNDDRNRMVLNHVSQTMDLGHEVFPDALYVLHPGESIEVPDLADVQRRRARELVRAVGTMAAKRGVIVAVENMRKGNPSERFVPRVGQEMEWIRETVEGCPNLGICLDTGHANISGNVLAMTRAAGDKLRIVHLSDNFGVTDDHLLPGRAAIPWRQLGAILHQEIDFQGPMTLEIKLPEEENELVAIFEQGRSIVDELLKNK